MKRYLPLLLLVGVFVLAAPAQAAACSGTGVTVVVQFPDHTTIGCAPGNPSSGYEALQEAGFSIALAQGSGAGALCEINGYPGAGACHTMPPANAYWAYFHASRGGSWSYSNVGAGSYDPAPGSVEGWRFGGGAAPSTLPPARVAPTAKPTPRPTATTKPTHAAAPATPSAPRSTATTRTPPATPTASPSTNVGAAPTSPATPSASPGLAAGTVQKTSSSSSKGSAWIWGVVLIVVLGGAAGTTALRRRRS